MSSQRRFPLARRTARCTGCKGRKSSAGAMAAETVSFGGLSLVKKDGTHSQRFPLVERRYLFGRYIRRDEGGGGVRRRAVLATVPSRRHNAGFWGHGRYLTIGV